MTTNDRPPTGPSRLRLLAAILAAILLGALALLPAAGARTAGARSSARGRIASGHLLLGISDNGLDTFADPRFAYLGMKIARLVIPWDMVDRGHEINWQGQWLDEARAHGATPLVVFEKDPTHPNTLPSVAAYTKAVKRFMADFPWIHDYSAWNEENHHLQPTSKNPRRAAEYFNAVSAACPSCQVTAADVLDIGNMAEWVEAFLPWAHHPKLWGIHNYADLALGSSARTRLLLSLVPGSLWITEAGGVVWRYEHGSPGHRGYFIRHGEAFAAQGAERLLEIAAVSPRITRIYYYQWRVPQTLAYAEKHPGDPSWDSGIIAPNCAVRPAFKVLARALGRSGRIPSAHLNRAGECV